MFDAEQNLPGFLMTNLHMLKMIHFQSKCEKFSNGWIFSKYYHTDEIFDCPKKPKPSPPMFFSATCQIYRRSRLIVTFQICPYFFL